MSNIIKALEVSARTLARRHRYAKQIRGAAVIKTSLENEVVVASLRKHGFYVQPNLLSLDQCAELQGEMDRIIAAQPDIVQRDAKASDERVHGAERASSAIRAFHDNAYLKQTGQAYFGAALGNISTLAGRLTYVADNLGSGQGWHRDSLWFQFKAMVYLSDVSVENGPFQILDGSHRASDLVKDTFHGEIIHEPWDRLADSQVEKIIAHAPERLRTFVAPAGTLILFNSSSIHRGSPIKAGRRYALTNYYYPERHIDEALRRLFEPFARTQ